MPAPDAIDTVVQPASADELTPMAGAREVNVAPRADTISGAGEGVFSPFESGACHCPWCPAASFSTPSGFMRHLTCMHEGTAINESMRGLLVALDRAACSAPGCGCLRRVGTRQCHRCGESHSLRPIAIGNSIPGGRGIALRGDPMPAPVHAPEAAPGAQGAADIVLPDSFTERVRRIPCNTIVHIPAASRMEIAIATTDCLEGLAAGLPGWSSLEEGRSKLLLAAIPDAASGQSEVAIRTASSLTCNFVIVSIVSSFG